MDKDVIRTALKEAIYQRRSTRVYTDKPIPDEIMDEIIDAGRHAPSGVNAQSTHFYVITNTEKRAELRDVMTDTMSRLTEQEGMSAPLLSMIKRAKQGQIDVTYGAPVLIVTTNKKGSHNAVADCSCALQNMMLTASAYGIGNVWINQFFMFRDKQPVHDFFAGLGVTEDEEICGALALGYTEDLETAPLPRTGNPVSYIK